MEEMVSFVRDRHLHHFGYAVSCCYVKQKDVHPFKGLKLQCLALELPVYNTLPNLENTNLIVDALFGYSFRPPIRGDFGKLIEQVNKESASRNIPIASLDIPSGWDIEMGPTENGGGIENPDFLISLSAPKMAASYFRGKYHYLGGRFVPGNISTKYNLNLPKFEGSSQFVRLSNL
eukprot:TRINITY_DN1100_c0_g1_i2.p1 TRINITY_DN1100_c0_g1~~TRINITY_DN1100_c0_g1_i2.p1  ORF type:complete len:176 (+),score=21.93 TRINITY_DN1100_c0_g1_i2:436-963(+)